MMEKLMKAYVVKEVMEKAAKDGSRYLRKKARNFDTDRALHRIGLATYKPGRASIGGAGLFLLGAAIGGIAALALAPKKGSELRTDLKNKIARRDVIPASPTTMRLENSGARV